MKPGGSVAGQELWSGVPQFIGGHGEKPVDEG
jgi:hypothetical protein